MKYSYMEIRLKINHKPRNKEYEKWIKEFIAKFNYFSVCICVLFFIHHFFITPPNTLFLNSI